MDQLNIKEQQLEDALASLPEILALVESAPEIYVFPLQQAAIQRFECCYDVFWKSVKTFLVRHYGIVIASPRGVFSEFEKTELISSTEFTQLMKMNEDRNLSTHTYHEDTAMDVFQAIPAHYKLMRDLTTRMSNKYKEEKQ